ncbi:N-acetylmuramoyl-L-alanine amidase [Rhizobium sp. NRK18]|uniref:N-acetylmuramoyl-L-alanine amidase n=1 Tax=Rhizobium sp. NRK18 TaxID=2964667 RepID=UPI0021C49C67|nr:N-acetylmuramoyl-L-alanine amidase [Rhizobium sp. NRK18]MCQ2004497.1 N-acetylmuramoyl-L-alanine amidase [Rhizobium sp. NRK18]
MRLFRLLRFLLASAAMMLPMLGASAKESALTAYDARIAGDDARTRIVIDFNQKPDFNVHYLDNPVRVVVDLPETSFTFSSGELKPRGLFSNIRYGAIDAGNARLVLTAPKPVRLAMSEVQDNEQDKGYRLVLDAEAISRDQFVALMGAQDKGASADEASAVADREPLAANASDFVIAVDAGHGGIDTGAIGLGSKVVEKDITLAFAKVVAERLGKISGVKVVMTRDDDEFLSLSRRVQIARQQGARLFISLHADTLRQHNIRGTTVYTISDKASDKLADDLAKRENLSDEMAGFTIADEPDDVTDILLDLTRRETQAFSISLAKSVVGSFDGKIRLINNPLRSAGFRVLKAPDIPSILIELGFLSNKEDEKLLMDQSWREKVADLIAAGVTGYKATVLANGG